MENKENKKEKFERLLCEQCDHVQNITADYLTMLTGIQVPYNIVMELADIVVDTLSANNIGICYPAYVGDDEVPCNDLEECPVGCAECPIKWNYF